MNSYLQLQLVDLEITASPCDLASLPWLFVDLGDARLLDRGPQSLKGESRRESLKHKLIENQRLSEPLVFQLDQENSHYLNKVLRIRAGEPLICIDIETEIPLACKYVETPSTRHAQSQIEIVALIKYQYTPSTVTTLLFPLIKGKREETVIEKVTEIGVREIILWQAERSIVKAANGRGDSSKLERLQAIARSAASQSRKNWVPKITFQTSLQAALSQITAETQTYCCSLAPQAVRLKSVSVAATSAAIVVGPEGDFSPNELDLIRKHKAIEISLSDFVLRSDTAAIVGVTALNARSSL